MASIRIGKNSVSPSRLFDWELSTDEDNNTSDEKCDDDDVNVNVNVNDDSFIDDSEAFPTGGMIEEEEDDDENDNDDDNIMLRRGGVTRSKTTRWGKSEGTKIIDTRTGTSFTKVSPLHGGDDDDSGGGNSNYVGDDNDMKAFLGDSNEAEDGINNNRTNPTLTTNKKHRRSTSIETTHDDVGSILNADTTITATTGKRLFFQTAAADYNNNNNNNNKGATPTCAPPAIISPRAKKKYKAVAPKFPLSAFRIFYQRERATMKERALFPTNDPHHPPRHNNHKSLVDRTIHERWISLPRTVRKEYEILAEKETSRYRTEMETYADDVGGGWQPQQQEQKKNNHHHTENSHNHASTHQVCVHDASTKRTKKSSLPHHQEQSYEIDECEKGNGSSSHRFRNQLLTFPRAVSSEEEELANPIPLHRKRAIPLRDGGGRSSLLMETARIDDEGGGAAAMHRGFATVGGHLPAKTNRNMNGDTIGATRIDRTQPPPNGMMWRFPHNRHYPYVGGPDPAAAAPQRDLPSSHHRHHHHAAQHHHYQGDNSGGRRRDAPRQSHAATAGFETGDNHAAISGHRPPPLVEDPSSSIPMPAGMEIILPDRETGRDRKYRVQYRCYTIPRQNLHHFLENISAGGVGSGSSSCSSSNTTANVASEPFRNFSPMPIQQHGKPSHHHVMELEKNGLPLPPFVVSPRGIRPSPNMRVPPPVTLPHRYGGVLPPPHHHAGMVPSSRREWGYRWS